MPTQQELLSSASKIDARLNNAKVTIKNAKQNKRQLIKTGERKNTQAEAAAKGDRLI